MLIVNLDGGLGNQMFQYAFGCSLAWEKEAPVKFDSTGLLYRDPSGDTPYTYRDFELGVFNGKVEQASAHDLDLFNHRAKGLLERVSYKLLRLLKSPQIYREDLTQNFMYEPSVWKTGPNTYFIGYWQTERYFLKYENLIRDAFKFTPDLVGRNREVAEQISTQNAVALHVRRGDYVTNLHYNKVHGTCSTAYYQQAVQYVTAHVSNPVLYIFSDDIDWVRHHMQFDLPSVHVSHNQGKYSYEDMRLMSLCRHNIIANSSFSWWSAWLNTNPQKIVIAPRQWIEFEHASSDLIPQTWIRL
jgi:hypothetical protein